MWLGVDGEGIGRFPHRYVMLCLSSSDGRKQDYIEDVNGLSTDACLRFLLHYGAHTLAGYYLSYDWTKILSDLPMRDIYRLFRPEFRARPRTEGGGFTPVVWRDYKLHYLSGMVRIHRRDESVTVWDVGKYYQARFVIALETSGIAPPELIGRMKLERGTWDESDLDRMREYCLEECTYLARLVELLQRQHEAIGLNPKVWHGPGSTAGCLLKKRSIDDHLAKPADGVQFAAECAYFGGRFEHSLIGERSHVYAYDVRSAYPHAIRTELPCLAHGRWVRQKRAPKDGDTALVRYRVRDIGDRVWGPLPCRLADGSIVWPRGGSTGWAWGREFQAASEYWTGVEYLRDAWVWKQECHCQPFTFIDELYQWRISRPENKQVVKLALNSMYGKIAQRIESRYSSRLWAGLITSTCRTRMLELIGRHADESKLLAIATDGAYSEERFDIGGSALGDWEVSDEGAMTFLRPGIYWSEEKVRARGVGRSHLTEQMAAAKQAIADRAPKLGMGTSIHFGNARQCVYRTPSGVYRRSKAYGEWVELPVSLSLAPEPKRDADWRPPMLDGVESAPYMAGARDARMLQVLGSLLEGRLARGR